MRRAIPTPAAAEVASAAPDTGRWKYFLTRDQVLETLNRATVPDDAPRLGAEPLNRFRDGYDQGIHPVIGPVIGTGDWDR